MKPSLRFRTSRTRMSLNDVKAKKRVDVSSPNDLFFIIIFFNI